MKIPYQPQQSPIDLGLANPVAAIFPAGYLTLQWDGHRHGKPTGKPGHIEFVFEDLKDVGLYLGGHFFRLVKFHFHAPSEHLVNRKSWPVELHAVHENEKTKQLAVLAIFIKGGQGREGASDFFHQFTSAYSEEATDCPPVEIDLRDLLPDECHDFYRYEGSLTTDPDQDNPEIVSWTIFREPLQVDPLRLRKFIKLGHSAKQVQKLHRRFVLTNFVP